MERKLRSQFLVSDFVDSYRSFKVSESLYSELKEKNRQEEIVCI